MKRLRIGICIVMLALMVMPVNSAYAGEYDDDFATVSTWLNDINGKLALVYSESTNILMQLNQRTISNTYTLRYYIEETYNDQHQMMLQFTTDTQNNSPTIRNYVSNISSKLSNIKTSIDSMSTDIGTIVTRQSSIATYAGNIYARLATTNTTLSDTYTLLYNWQSSWVAYKNQLLDWGTSWNTTFGTISTNIAAINNNLITGFTSIEGKLDTLHTDLNNIYTLFNGMVKTYTTSTGATIPYVNVQLTRSNSNYPNYDMVDKFYTACTNVNSMLKDYSTPLSNIYSAVDGIEGKLDTIHTDLNNIYNIFNGMTRQYTDSLGNTTKYMRVVLLWPNDSYPAYFESDTLHTALIAIKDKMKDYTTVLGNIYTSLGNVKDYTNQLNSLLTAVNGLQAPTVNIDTSTIQNQLSTIISLMSIPTNPNQVIGNLNTVDFSDDVDGLIDTISTLAPFGAVLLVSEEISILASVSPIDNPAFTVPFNFAGTNNVVIDLSWMDNIRNLVNFFNMFMLIFALGAISLKFVQNEAI